MHKLLLTACTLLLCATRGSAQACAAPNSSVALSSTASAILNSSSPPQLYLTSGGRNRSYYIQLPTGYTPNQAYPLVLGFHGSQSIGLYFPLDTKMDDARYSNNKIMVYPDGVGGSWAGPSYHNGTSVDEDIQFVADVIANVKAQFCVDAERVFGVGIATITCNIYLNYAGTSVVSSLLATPAPPLSSHPLRRTLTITTTATRLFS